MSCTIGAISRKDKTFMLKNFDYAAVPLTWAEFVCCDGYNHFALVDHNQQGVNSGLNVKGLGLIISRSDGRGGGTQEKRTVINAEILSRHNDVEGAVRRLEDYAKGNPGMYGGNVILADECHIAVVEYFAGKTQSEILEEGYIARANHSIFGLVENCGEHSRLRYCRMEGFLADLYPKLPELSREEIVERCRALLRDKPLLQDSTRSSFVIDIQNRRVDYMIEQGKWRRYILQRR